MRWLKSKCAQIDLTSCNLMCMEAFISSTHFFIPYVYCITLLMTTHSCFYKHDDMFRLDWVWCVNELECCTNETFFSKKYHLFLCINSQNTCLQWANSLVTINNRQHPSLVLFAHSKLESTFFIVFIVQDKIDRHS